MQELPIVGQSAATTHCARQVPNAQMRPAAQSLLSAQRDGASAVDVVHAGAASAKANASQLDPIATDALRDLPGLCAIRFIDSPP
jgi:hypothetical protein